MEVGGSREQNWAEGGWNWAGEDWAQWGLGTAAYATVESYIPLQAMEMDTGLL